MLKTLRYNLWYPDIHPLDNWFPLGNCPNEILLRATDPWTFAPEHFSLNNSSTNNYHWTTVPTTPWYSSRNKWQWTFALENYPWIICRRRLKKVLLTHSVLEILNKFRKKIKQWVVHTTSWRHFTSRKSMLKMNGT